MFLCDPTVGDIFGYLATVLPLQPIKSLLLFIHCNFSAFEGIQSGITEDITISVQWVSDRHLLSTKQAVVNTGKNKKFTLNFLSFVICFKVYELGKGKIPLLLGARDEEWATDTE